MSVYHWNNYFILLPGGRTVHAPTTRMGTSFEMVLQTIQCGSTGYKRHYKPYYQFRNQINNYEVLTLSQYVGSSW